MGIPRKDVTGTAATGVYEAGGAGVGFSVEPGSGTPFPASYPVKVRLNGDASTDFLLSDGRPEFRGGGFTKVELVDVPSGVRWHVCIYETVNDWREGAPPHYASLKITGTGLAGHILYTLPLMQRPDTTRVEAKCTMGGTPLLGSSSTGTATALRTDTSGRLEVVRGSRMLTSGNINAQGIAAGSYTSATYDTAALAAVQLRVVGAAMTGGTSLTMYLDEVDASGGLVCPVGVGGSGFSLAPGFSGTLQLGEAFDGGTSTRLSYPVRPVRTRVRWVITGAPSAVAGSYELWGLA